MTGPDNRFRLRGPGAVFLLFLLVSILLFAAGGGRIGSRLIGNADHPGLHGEMFHQQDFLDNVLAGRWSQPYFSHRIAQPHGEDMRPYVGISLHLFHYLPFAMFGNPVLRYNALMILTLALNGFCAYRLARHLTASTFAAILGGLLFLLSPYAFLKLETGFLQKTILWWIPLFLLEVFRFFEERSLRRAVLAGLYWALMLLTYAPYAVYGLAAAAIVFVGRVARHPRDIPALLRRASPALLPAGLALGLFVIAFPHGVSSREGDIPQAILDAPLGSIDLRHPFRSLPYSDFIPMARHLPAGISCLGLVLGAWALAGRRRHSVLFAVLAGFSFLLSLGCHLHSLGRPFDAIPLPYYFLARFAPGGDRLGFPLRALPYADLSLAILAALAVGGAGRRFAGRPRWVAVACASVLLLAALAERRLVWPELFPARSTAHVLSPEIRWLRDRGGVVLHLPYVPRGPDCRRYIYISAMSGTRMLNHYLEAPPGFPDIPRGPVSNRERILYLERLHRLGCDFIAVHPNLMTQAEPPLRTSAGTAPGPAVTADDVTALRALCGPPAFAGADTILHRVPPPAALDADARVSAAAIRARIESHPGEVHREPQIRVHRFAIPVPPGADEETRRAARREAGALARRLEADPEVTFAHAEDLARSDPARRWGDLGYISRGTFPPDVEDPLFALTRPGQTTVVEQPGAILVFVVMDVRPGAEGSPDDARRAAADAVLRESRRLFAGTKPRPDDDMIHIPGGEFLAGSTDAEIDRAAAMASRFAGRIGPVDRRWFEDEAARRVSVGPFFMDRHEVTRGAYEEFVKATGHRPLPGWVHEVATDPSMPVVGVSWHDARAFAAWAGKRLPTVEEWEWAARGPARRWFPWGDDEPDGSRGNYADASSGFPWCDERHDDTHPRLAPVGSYPAGATPEGILDMGGNAREWTSTERQGYVDPETQHIWDFRQVPAVFPDRTNAAPIAMVAVRGGAWRNAADDLRPSDERILPPDTLDPTQGFRCVRDVPAAAEAAVP
jgi:formylglycine-generating enzyme required for sulfatase activity